MGRPKKISGQAHVKSFRLENYHIRMLQLLERNMGLTRSEVIREAIENLYEREIIKKNRM